jgi:mono/diheme cytochrome c family protein
MGEVVYYSTSRMSGSDLAAIATYLKDAAPSGRVAAPATPGAVAMSDGEAIYVDNCSACHRANGQGAARLFPPLAGDSAAQSIDPTTLARIILTGVRSIPTPGAPTPLAMPPYGSKLSDAQIAAVATYVRNSWGNVAPAVSASQVATLRRHLTR